jgi:inner membrane protein
MLISFYGFVYVLLQMEDYSLLLGNFALFLILAAIMFFTRKVNWFDVLKGKV